MIEKLEDRTLLSTNVVAQWQFDEGSGTTALDSAGTNDGTLMNGPVWTTGAIDGALSFDGIDDYVAVPDSPSLDLTTAMTMETWVRFDSVDDRYETIVTKVGAGEIPTDISYALRRYRTGNLSESWMGKLASDIYTTSGRSEVYGTTVPVAGQWYHLVSTYDGTTHSVYVNGVLESTQPHSGDIITSNDPLWIGKLGQPQLPSPLNGTVDDVAIYSRALTAGEISSRFQAGWNDAPTVVSPIADVVEDENASDTVIDLFATFEDPEDADADLTYSIESNTNPALFAAAVVDPVAGTITLDYVADTFGAADIVVRATDTGGRFVDEAFSVRVYGAGEPRPVGSEFRVNSSTSGTQLYSAVAADPDGNFVFTWESDHDSDSMLIYGRRYDASGIPLGGQFRASDHHTFYPRLRPHAAMDFDGNFIISWQHNNWVDWNVQGQRYNANDSTVGGRFNVPSTNSGHQTEPYIAFDAAGNFVITWMNESGRDGSGAGVYARRYNSSGSPVGSDFRVNTYTSGNQWYPAVAMNPAGDSVIVWGSNGQDGSGYGVYGQRFESGVAVGEEFPVNTLTDGNQRNPSVAMDEDGNFVVAWDDHVSDGSGKGVYARRFNALGEWLDEEEFRVNTFTNGNQASAAVQMDVDGDFVVVWASQNQDGSGYGVYGQRFGASGERLGGEFRVNSTVSGDQIPFFMRSIGMAADGDFVVGWHGNGPGDGAGIFGQRFEIPKVQVAPTADAGGPYTVQYGSTVQLDASETRDPNQYRVTLEYAWDLDGDAVFGETGVSAERGDEVGMTPVFDATGISASSPVTIALLVTDDTRLSDSVTTTVTVQNSAPTISDIADQATDEDVTVGPLSFTVSDAETSAGDLTVTATSDDQALIPDANVVSGGSDSNRTITLTPAENQGGTATITVTVSDGELTASDTFQVTVTPANDPPTLDPISDAAAIDENAGEQTVDLTGISAGVGEWQDLLVTSTSSNPGLIPDPTVTYPASPNLIALYPLDGSANDTSGNGHDGTVYGATLGVDRFDTADHAYQFDGIDDYISLGNIVDPAGSAGLTVTAWAKADDLYYGGQNRIRPIVFKRKFAGRSYVPQFSLILDGRGGEDRARFFLAANDFGDGNASVSTPLQSVNTGEWHHVAGVYDPASQTMKIYLDGQPAASQSYVPLIYGSPEDVMIGKTTYGDHFDGGIDDVRIFERALSDEEVLAIASGPDSTGSLAYTPVADQSGTAEITVTVTDAGLNGTLGDADDASVQRTFTVTVNPTNVAPVVNVEPDAAIDEGQTFTGSGSFTDPDAADTWTATVDYGDGSGVRALPLNPEKTFELSHLYADDGQYTITVTVTDGEADAGSDQMLVTVANVAPTIELNGVSSVAEGSPYTLTLGDVTDPGDDTVSSYVVHWGDGTTDTYSAPGDVTHVYADGIFDPATGDQVLVNVNTWEDTYITDAAGLGGPNSTHGDDGSLWSINYFTPGGGGSLATRPMMKFDLSSYAGSEVTGDATFRTYVVGPNNPDYWHSQSRRVDLYQLTAAWGADTVSWNTRPGSSFISSLWIQYDHVSDNGYVEWTTPQSIVQSWLDDPASNHGVMIVNELPDSFFYDLVFAAVEHPVGEPAQLEFDVIKHPLTITVDLVDEDGTHPDAGSLDVRVENVAPDFELGPDQSLPPNQAGHLTRSDIPFTDPGADVWSGTVDFGDGTGDQPFPIDRTAKTFDLDHTYAAAGNYTVSVTISDDDGGSHTDSFNVEIVAVFDLVPGIQDGQPGSLRAAISAANANGLDDVINLAPGTYTLTLSGAGEDSNATGDLDLTEAGHSIVIRGGDAGTTVIDASGIDRVFQVFPGISLDLSGVTVTGGTTTGSDYGGGIHNAGALTLTDTSVTGNNTEYANGGGIYNDYGTLTVSNSTISANSCSGYKGGGIYNYGGSVEITDSTVSDNSAPREGGGIYTQIGTVTITDSTLSGNYTGVYGGAIFTFSGTVSVSNSRISENSAVSSGAGIHNLGTLTITNSAISDNTGNSGVNNLTTGVMEIVNSTISGNTGHGGMRNRGDATVTNTTISGNEGRYGGGIMAEGGVLRLSHSTVTGNVAWIAQGGRGGGVLIAGSAGSGALEVDHTIIAGNTASTEPDVLGSFTSLGHNLIGDVTGATGFVDGVNGDQVGGAGNPVIDALLGRLQDNGGPTSTHALLAGSPAIDAGDNTDAPAFDQRGVTRILDSDGDGTATIDIGAFERQNAPPTANAGGPYFVDEGGSAQLDGSGSVDPDDGIAAYDWDFDYDGVTFDADASGVSPVFDALGLDGPETRTVALRVSDTVGAGDIATTTVTVNNVAPHFELGFDTVLLPDQAGHLIRSNITFADRGADVWTGTVDYGDGSGDQPLAIDQTAKTFDLDHTYTVESSYTVSVTITDDDGGSHADSFTVDVFLNTAPVAEPDDVTTNEDTPIVIDVLADNGHGADFDAENNIDPTLAVNLTSPSLGSLTNHYDGTFTFNPAGQFEALAAGESTTETFEYQIEDTYGETATATVTITVNGVNDAPTITDIADETTDEDAAVGPLVFTVADAETAAGDLIVTAASDNQTMIPDANLTLAGSNANRTITLTPAANQSGTATITVTVSDGTVSTSDTFHLTVNPVNDVPVADPQSVATDEAATLAITLTGEDGDPELDQVLTFAAVAGPSHGTLTLDPATGSATYSPDADYNGPDSFTFTVTDDATAGGAGLTSSPAAVSLDVSPVNDTPALVHPIADVTANEDDPDRWLDLSDVFDDVDMVTNSDSLTLTVAANTNQGLMSATLVDTTLTLDYLADRSGTAEVTVRATDLAGAFVEDTFTVTVESGLDQIGQNLDQIQGLVDDGDLDQKDADKLIDRLEKAHAKLAKGQNDKAIEEVEKFIKETEKLMDHGDLSAVDGQALIDGAGDIITAFGVSAPQEQALLLADDVQGLIDAGDLSNKDGNRLIKDLDKAVGEFDKLHVNHGIDKLEKFIKEVGKLVDKGKLNETEGQTLVAAANAIIDTAIPATPQQQRTILLNVEVEGLVETGELAEKDGEKLSKELDKAIKEFGKLDIDKAVEKLDKFIAEVQNLVDDGKLSTAHGQPLIDSANAIIDDAMSDDAGGRSVTFSDVDSAFESAGSWIDQV